MRVRGFVWLAESLLRRCLVARRFQLVIFHIVSLDCRWVRLASLRVQPSVNELRHFLLGRIGKAV
jgi:hypothetical protein